ncbi:efflux RND transporter periplasmic adaptor subunit [Hyalangium gracile]|uniref:efflux RND transporter periplasmic adaptor subunit n=1 Tax=Hyalangium gracile TaxID=394092 RepID=UPI001CCE5D15|nr:efflux RND transporter periplasmic adaptor subunit [Hyalangium gracile]
MPKRLFIVCVALLIPLMVGLLVLTRLGASGLRASAQQVPLPAPHEEARESLGKAHPAAARRFTGVVVAREAVHLSPRFDGRLESVAVQVGDTVRAGEILARMDTQPLEREMAIAQAALKSARVELEVARIALEEAQARLRRRSDPRQISLGAISEEELATAQFEERLATTKVVGAQVRIQEREAQIAKFQQQLDSALLRAPFDGTVAARYSDPGVQLAQGQPLLHLLRSRAPWIRFAVSEHEVPGIVPGMPVEVRIQNSSLLLRGRVEKVAPEIDAASRMVLAIASLKEEGTDLVRSGLVAEVLVAPNARAEVEPPKNFLPSSDERTADARKDLALPQGSTGAP